MDAAATVNRRAFWFSLFALVLALPVAIAVHSWSSVTEWSARNVREPIDVPAGQAVGYSAATWSLARLEAIRTTDPAAQVVLAELDAVAQDIETIVQDACTLTLSDEAGRHWRPTMLIEPAARERYPDVASRSVCGAPAFDGLKSGDKALMAATFILPADATGVKLSMSLSSQAPRELRFALPAR